MVAMDEYYDLAEDAMAIEPKSAVNLAGVDQEQLIGDHVEDHPFRPGVEHAILKKHGYSVWILIDALQAAGGDPGQVAREYEIPLDAVIAAVAYYSRHREAIDAHARSTALFHGAVSS